MSETVYVVACAECGDQYTTTHKGRAIAVKEGMQRTYDNQFSRMHGNGHVDHSHEDLSVVTCEASKFPVTPNA